jgi:hypothetical protein
VLVARVRARERVTSIRAPRARSSSVAVGVDRISTTSATRMRWRRQAPVDLVQLQRLSRQRRGGASGPA